MDAGPQVLEAPSEGRKMRDEEDVTGKLRRSYAITVLLSNSLSVFTATYLVSGGNDRKVRRTFFI